MYIRNTEISIYFCVFYIQNLRFLISKKISNIFLIKNYFVIFSTHTIFKINLLNFFNIASLFYIEEFLISLFIASGKYIKEKHDIFLRIPFDGNVSINDKIQGEICVFGDPIWNEIATKYDSLKFKQIDKFGERSYNLA